MSLDDVLAKLLDLGFDRINIVDGNPVILYRVRCVIITIRLKIFDFDLFIKQGKQNNYFICNYCKQQSYCRIEKYKKIFVLNCGCARKSVVAGEIISGDVDVEHYLQTRRDLFVMMIHKKSRLRQIPRCVMKYIIELSHN